MKKVTSEISGTVFSLPWLVAKDHGLFEAEGIDIEFVRSDLDYDLISARYFSPEETAALRVISRDAQLQAFFACWTRKEAYIKARGEGLSIPLDQFDVSMAPDEPPALLNTAWDPKEASRWSLRHINPGPGYTGALAVEGHDWQLRFWQWTELQGGDPELKL